MSYVVLTELKSSAYGADSRMANYEELGNKLSGTGDPECC
jgi:hypothetical protein